MGANIHMSVHVQVPLSTSSTQLPQQFIAFNVPQRQNDWNTVPISMPNVMMSSMIPSKPITSTTTQLNHQLFSFVPKVNAIATTNAIINAGNRAGQKRVGPN